MCEQLFKTIIKHSVKCQFGSTPGVGCQDGPFTIKTSTYKTKIQYPIMGGTCRPSQVLKHPQLCTTRHHTGKIWHYPNTIPINKMHAWIKRIQDHHCQYWDIHRLQSGCKTRGCMEPLLFMLLMMAFAKTLEDDCTDLGLNKAQFSHIYNPPRSTRQLVSHQPGTFTSGTLFDIFCIIYVYDSVFFFEYRTDIKKIITLLSDHFARFGLGMHIGTNPPSQKLNASSSCL